MSTAPLPLALLFRRRSQGWAKGETQKWARGKMGKKENGFQLRVSIFQFPISSFRSPVYTPSFDDSMSRFPPFSSFFPLLHSIKDWLEPGWVNGERGNGFAIHQGCDFETGNSKIEIEIEIRDRKPFFPLAHFPASFTRSLNDSMIQSPDGPILLFSLCPFSPFPVSPFSRFPFFPFPLFSLPLRAKAASTAPSRVRKAFSTRRLHSSAALKAG